MAEKEKEVSEGSGLAEDDHIRILGPVEAKVVDTRKLDDKERNLNSQAKNEEEEEDAEKIEQYVVVVELPVDNEGVVYYKLDEVPVAVAEEEE